jgi:putative hydrolase of the HAD superfamily
MNDISAILFDLGGTLDGPGQPWVDRFASAYGAAGIAVAPERLHEACGEGTRAAYASREIAGYDLRATVGLHVAAQLAHLGLEDADAARRVVDGFVASTVAALEESRTVLERLAPRFALGVVSNYYGNAARVLNDAGIARLLRVVVDSAVCGLSKPDPAIFALALARLDVPARRALYVGDSVRQDVIPAKAAGLRTAWLVGAGEPPSTSPADVCVRTLGELERLLAP